MGVACAMALLLVVLPATGNFTGQGRLPVPLEWAPLRYAGLISYSVYLWHVPVIWWLNERGTHFENDALIPNFLIVAGLTTALATATYYGVEAQAYKFRGKATAGPQLERAGSGFKPRSERTTRN